MLLPRVRAPTRRTGGSLASRVMRAVRGWTDHGSASALYTPAEMLEEDDAHEKHLQPAVLMEALRETFARIPQALACGLIGVCLLFWLFRIRLSWMAL